MKILRPFVMTDLFILFKCEQFAHWWQKLTGLNNFWLSRVCALIYLFFAVKLGIMVIPLFLYNTINFLYRISITERKLKQNYENSAKVDFISVRILLLIVTPICFACVVGLVRDVYFIVNMTFIILAHVSCLYFMSCTPLPPGESKIKRWARKATEWVIESITPAPEPVPVPVSSGSW